MDTNNTNKQHNICSFKLSIYHIWYKCIIANIFVTFKFFFFYHTNLDKIYYKLRICAKYERWNLYTAHIDSYFIPLSLCNAYKELKKKKEKKLHINNAL